MNAIKKSVSASHQNNVVCLNRARGEKNTKRASRRLFMIDIENYCGKGMISQDDVRCAKSKITKEFHIMSDDLLVIGTSSRQNWFASAMEWRGPRQVVKMGHNGADMALIQAFDQYDLNRFASVVVISGDGAFVEIVEACNERGKEVLVASRKKSLSRKLCAVTPLIRYIGADEPKIA